MLPKTCNTGQNLVWVEKEGRGMNTLIVSLASTLLTTIPLPLPDRNITCKDVLSLYRDWSCM